MPSKEAPIFPVSLTVEISPTEVDAGAELSLKAIATCPDEFDISGDVVSFRSADGAELATAPLKVDSDGRYATDPVVIAAPVSLGPHVFAAVLAPVHTDEAAHEGARAEATASSQPHTAYLNAWDVPAAVAVGDAFSFRVGIKCSCGCNLGRRAFQILDETGRVVARGRLGQSPWPNTSALYVASIQATAPAEIGTRSWRVTFAGSRRGVPHAGGSLSFALRTVATPDHSVTITVVNRDTGAPLAGAQIVLHPYRAITDGQGTARLGVAAGRYRLHISGHRCIPFDDDVDASSEVALRVMLAPEQPRSPYFPMPTPQQPSIAEVIK